MAKFHAAHAAGSVLQIKRYLYCDCSSSAKFASYPNCEQIRFNIYNKYGWNERVLLAFSKPVMKWTDVVTAFCRLPE